MHGNDRRTDVRNIAIIAHVDHGKTTLVDGLLAQTGALRARGEVRECILDGMDQERERGITITSKVCAVEYEGVRVNLIDTPGHADFGGEVERIVRMADGCLLLVDASEQVMPQTRFVLGKALACDLVPILVVNKIDKAGADPAATVDAVFDLMVELEAADHQLDFPVLYGCGRDRYMNWQPDPQEGDLCPLLETMLATVPGPRVDPSAPLQLQVASIEYNDFVGRIAVGRVHAGSLTAGCRVTLLSGPDAVPRSERILQLHLPRGLDREEVDRVEAGDIAMLTGIDDVEISATICDTEHPVALPPIPIDQPTISMRFGVSTSPLTGSEGKPLQSRELIARLRRERERNVALRVAETGEADTFEVSGRGLLHLSVLIETMRREGAEFQVGPPQVIYREDERGRRLEPIELVAIDSPEDCASRIVNLLLERRGELTAMTPYGGRQHLEFLVPSRCTGGLRTAVLSASQGEATPHSVFHSYQPYKGDVPGRRNGVMISLVGGEAAGYGLFSLQPRGELFVEPGMPLYAGLVIGEHAKENDIEVNPAREKKLTNIRNAGAAEEAIRLVPPRRMSLEESLEYLAVDEVLEVTPRSLRIRKTLLDPVARKRASRG